MPGSLKGSNLGEMVLWVIKHHVFRPLLLTATQLSDNWIEWSTNTDRCLAGSCWLEAANLTKVSSCTGVLRITKQTQRGQDHDVPRSPYTRRRPSLVCSKGSYRGKYCQPHVHQLPKSIRLWQWSSLPEKDFQWYILPKALVWISGYNI